MHCQYLIIILVQNIADKCYWNKYNLKSEPKICCLSRNFDENNIHFHDLIGEMFGIFGRRTDLERHKCFGYDVMTQGAWLVATIVDANLSYCKKWVFI